MKNDFTSAALAGLLTFVPQGALANVQDPNCYFDVPPEIPVIEYMKRKSYGEILPEGMMAMRPDYLHFQGEQAIDMYVDEGTRVITLFNTMDVLQGQSVSIKRFERNDESFDVDDSYLGGSVIMIQPDTGLVTVLLESGEADSLVLKPVDPMDNDMQGYDLAGYFSDAQVLVTVTDTFNKQTELRISARDSYATMYFNEHDIQLVTGHRIDWQPPSPKAVTGLTRVNCKVTAQTDAFGAHPQGLRLPQP